MPALDVAPESGYSPYQLVSYPVSCLSDVRRLLLTLAEDLAISASVGSLRGEGGAAACQTCFVPGGDVLVIRDTGPYRCQGR
jgi:hypothetical protein